MTNQLSQLLQTWHKQKDSAQWVLGTVYKIEGPSYRKPGAMMLFNDLGQQFGLLSGGCLESDIQKHASRVMDSKQAVTLCYDGTDEDDMSFMLGIGCGGTIYILLQPLLAENNFLGLEDVIEALDNRECSVLLQKIPEQSEAAASQYLAAEDTDYSAMVAQLNAKRATLINRNKQTWLATHIKPPPHLLVVGGGVDARPLVNLAAETGWEVSLCDPRPANARREHFMSASSLLRCAPKSLADEPLFKYFDAAVVMTHNLQLDADALVALQHSGVRYLAVLGPAARKLQVLELAGLTEQRFAVPIAGPAGLSLGAELPEEIALSILAECHAMLNRVDASSLSGVLGPVNTNGTALANA